MTTDLKQLPPPEQKVAAKVLQQSGYSTKRMGELLGIDRTTAWRYAQEQTPEELQQFETDFKAIIAEAKREGIGLVHKRMLKIIPTYQRLDHLVKAAEYFEGKRSPDEGGVTNNTQINNYNQLPDDQLDQLITTKLREAGIAPAPAGEGTQASAGPAQVREATQQAA
jgi:predicted transcriptional regulator